MKKLFIIAIGCFLSIGQIWAGELREDLPQNDYVYIDLGIGPAPILIPQFGAGYRYQTESHGYDVNFKFTTVIDYSAMKFGANYLYFPNPNPKEQFYFGAGPAIGILFVGDRFFAFSPEFLLGWQTLSSEGNPRHWQANILWPALMPNDGFISVYPLVSASYAWSY